ncbi:MAG: EAL domain-containing protein [Clostridium sp.]
MTEQLVNAGFKLHMDDFGSGYSSMLCLNQSPFGALKIDKSLIDHVCEEKENISRAGDHAVKT